MKSLLLSLILAAGASAVFAAPAIDCTQLSRTQFAPDVTIDSAKLMAASDELPEHCEVRGMFWPDAHFVVKLPTEWNQRFQMVGNGGWAGTISESAVNQAIGMGYASTSTDTGHSSQREPGATWAMQTDENPYAARKVIDHGYLSVHETAMLAKEMIKAYYGEAPQYSYWVGCSTGGRQGLMEAQRYPEDFDGYVIGAPVLYLTGLQTKAVYNWIQIGPGPGEMSPEDWELVAGVVNERCDAVDGLEDGLFENPLDCDFVPLRDLPRCASGKSSDCLTKAQIDGVAIVYDGVRDSEGRKVFPGMPPGPEAMAAGRGGVQSGLAGGLGPSFNLGDTFFKFMAFDDPPGETWDYHTLDIDRDLPRTRNVGLRIDATIPDLTAAKMHGAKIVHYHGWSDQGVTSLMSLEYYKKAQATMGVSETEEFWRFFPVPGMFHCAGGPGCGNVDWLSAVVDWVENGKAPEQLVGAHIENGETTRTRPICMWPTHAKYNGSGSIDEAGNFSCE